jgi:signal peptide peptidase SppA
MRFEHIIRAVFHEPWLITAAAHQSLSRLVETHILDPHAVTRTGDDGCGNQVDLPSMMVEDGIAIIPVAGVMGKKLTGFEKGAGAVDTLDVIADINEAVSNPDVKAIVFDIDSPGGMVSGTPELADAIRNAGKPTMAYGSGDIASAAYWIAAAADEVWASPSSVVGSIGVYMPFIDASKRYADAGYKVEMFRTGTYKGMGYPGTSLTNEQRALLQSQVDDLGTQFRAWVVSRRGEIAMEDMQGQTFKASDGQNRGLVDHVTANWRADYRPVG